jgi:prepilin-type N-terminal cleavage/methylation domain-containing protein
MRNAGFTLIELIIVICIVALTFGFGLERLLRYQEMGERAAVEQNIAAINSALTMKFAAYVTSGRPERAMAEAGKNPVEVLARPPQNYLGELYAPDTATLERQSWYFDRQSRDFVYLPNRRRYVSVRGGGSPDQLRFRIYVSEVKAEPGQPRELAMPFIAPVVPFDWTIE